MLTNKEQAELEAARSKAIQAIQDIPMVPSQQEINLSADCHRCRNYFGKLGPLCDHCKRYDVIEAYGKKIYAFRTTRKLIFSNMIMDEPTRGGGGGGSDVSGANRVTDSLAIKEYEAERVDSAFLMMVKHLRSHISRYMVTHRYNDDEEEEDEDESFLPGLKDLAYAEEKRCENMKLEIVAMNNVHKTYDYLMKVHDELTQTKRRQEMAYLPGEAALLLGSASSSSAAALSSSSSSSFSNPSNHHQVLDDIDASKDENGKKRFLYHYELQERYVENYSGMLGAESELKDASNMLTFYKTQESEARLAKARLLAGIMKRNRSKHKASSHPVQGGGSSGSGDVVMGEGSDDDGEGMDETCIICREKLTDAPLPTGDTPTSKRKSKTSSAVSNHVVVVLSCAHQYHKSCILHWFKKNHTCPICKRPSKPSELMPVDNRVYIPRPPSPTPSLTLVNSLMSEFNDDENGEGSNGNDNGNNGSGSNAFNGNHATAAAIAAVTVHMDVDDDQIPSLVTSNSANASPSKKSINSSHNTNPHQRNHNQVALDHVDFDNQDHDDDLDLVVQGEWGTKVEALITDLLRLVGSTNQETAPRLGLGKGVGLGKGSGLGLDRDYGETKAIVFSQWPEMLDIVREALEANHIAHAGTNTPFVSSVFATPWRR